jgi:ribosome modulation factor
MSDANANVHPITPNTEARRKGYHAGRRGLTATDNPYERDTREARAWLRGLNDGRMRRLALVPQE